MQPEIVVATGSPGEIEQSDMQNVHEFARRFRLSMQEEHRLIARSGATASRQVLLVNAKRELAS